MENNINIMMLPGIFNTGECFEAMAKSLANDFDCRSISYPGYYTRFFEPRPMYGSKITMKSQIEFCRENIVAFKAAMKPEKKLIILGHSKGALYAAKLAMDLGSKYIDGLILCNSAPPRGISAVNRKTLWVFKSCIWSMLWGRYAKRCFPDTAKYVLNGLPNQRDIWENMFWEPRSVLLGLMRPPKIHLAGFDGPILMLAGEIDLLITTRIANEIAIKFSADLRIIPQAPHYLLDRPIVARVIERWLNNKFPA